MHRQRDGNTIRTGHDEHGIEWSFPGDGVAIGYKTDVARVLAEIACVIGGAALLVAIIRRPDRRLGE